MAYGLNPSSVLQLLAQYKYEFLVPGALFIGPLVSLTAGVLIRLGVFDLWAAAAVLMTTELLGDIFWYWIGFTWGENFAHRFGRYVGISRELVARVRALYEIHHDKIIIISKLTAGFGFAPAIYFTAGLSRVSFLRYMIINIVGQIIWTSAMLAIGFYLGHFYLQFNGALDRVFFVTFVLVLFAIVVGFGHYLWSKLSEAPSS